MYVSCDCLLLTNCWKSIFFHVVFCLYIFIYYFFFSEKVETGFENDGFSNLSENVETKDTVREARHVENSSVDMYENADQVPDVYISEIKEAIKVKSRNKNSGFKKEYSVSQTKNFHLIKRYHWFDIHNIQLCCIPFINIGLTVLIVEWKCNISLLPVMYKTN